MKDLFFIQDQEQIITGPFDKNHLMQLLKKQQITPDTLLSLDKVEWQSLQKTFALIVPPTSASTPPEAPVLVKNNEQSSGQAAAQTPPAEKSSDEYYGKNAPLPNNSPRILYLINNTLSSLGDGSTYLQKIALQGTNAMIGSGILAFFFSLAVAISGALLFAGRYPHPPLATILRSVIFVASSGGFCWLFNLSVRIMFCSKQKIQRAEADFLTAMHVMMSMAVLSVIAHGSLFIYCSDIYSATYYQKILLGAFAMLLGGFFLANSLQSLRINFMANAHLPAGAATAAAVLELWCLMIFFVFVQFRMYGIV